MYGRTNGHLKVLGMIEVVYGLIHVLLCLAVGSMSLLGCSICSSSDHLAEGMAAGLAWAGIWGFLGIAGAVLFAVPILAGLALANGRGWAKIVTLIFAVLVIAEFPLGTVFAVYAFWAILVDDK